MSKRERSMNRRQEILETLARELESNPGSRITTASLASAVGVSEAALYRHFASKAKMFEALIDFAEESIFGLINQILEQEKDPAARCQKIISLVLKFSEKNPGISRILAGDALVGENDRLRQRVAQFFERLQTQFRQVLREANLESHIRAAHSIEATASLLMTLIEGRMSAYIRSSFEDKPGAYLDEQWSICQPGMFKS